MIIKIIFWALIIIIVYTYFGYTLLLFIVSLFFRKRSDTVPNKNDYSLPEISLLIAAYNEADIIESKMLNISSLKYPSGKLEILWVTDGSDDGSEKLLETYPGVRVIHQQKREGKSMAINRAMKYVNSSIVVLSDANAMLNSEALLNIAMGFRDKRVGCIAGEKRIKRSKSGDAVSSGEGTYWKYESIIKRLESAIGSAIGGAGELIAFRRELIDEIDSEVINDDFEISLQIIRKGYRVKYSPDSYATENASLNMREERKRKIRITAGGIQCLIRNFGIMNPFKYGFYSFQFFSHKVLRWTLVPFSFFPVLILNSLIIASSQNHHQIYYYTLGLQIIFYIMVLAGKVFSHSNLGLRLLFIPYYLFTINHASVLGVLRYIKRDYSPLWEKARRIK